MRKILTLLFLILLLPLFSGCGQAPKLPLYNWGNYANSSTEYGMKGHEKEIFDKHLLQLETIINESEAEKKRVAPGLYAEYGQMLYESNKKNDAKKYFLLEQTTYPESKEFMNRVMVKLYGDSK